MIDPKKLLAYMRTEIMPDKKWVNYFDEHVWMKAFIHKGKRIGVTECCFVDDPCERHLQMEEIANVN